MTENCQKKPENCRPKISSNILIYCLVGNEVKAKYNELKKIKNFLIILLKLVFSDKTINGYCMKFMAINAETDLNDYLFCFKKRMKR